MHFEGVADCMRYELLYRRGGYMACADSICLHPIDGLLSKTCAYTCYTNEFLEGASVVPILACEPGNPFLGELIQRLSKIDPLKLSAPWISTGNLFVARMIRELDPEIVIWPSHYLIPEHYRGEIYKGSDLIYARQLWGTTRGLFKETDGIKGKISVLKMKFIRKRHLRNKKKMAASQK